MSEKETNGWNQHQIYVIKELERLNSNYELLSKEVQQVREDIATLKVKSGVWGAVGAAVTAVLFLLAKIKFF